MLKAEQIPDEVVLELWEATGEEPVGVLACLVDAKIYLAAALNAWPGVVKNYSWDASHGRIILPLKENTNDKT